MSSEIALDLNRRAWTRARGIITVIGTWVRLPGEQTWEQCLALIRTGEEYSEHTKPCIIPLRNAHIWYEGFGDPTVAARASAGFVKALRLPEDPKSMIKIAKLVNDFLEDLLIIPPWVAEDGGELTLGEVTLTNLNTGRTTEHVLKDV